MIPSAAATPAYGLAAAASWGASDFTGGLASRKADAFLIVAIAHGLSLVLLIVLALALHAAAPSIHTLIWGLLTGVAGGIALIVFYQALSLGTMGPAAALTGLLTAVVPVLFSFWTQGLPGGRTLAGFALAGAAIWLIAAPEGKQQARARHERRAITLATIAGLGFGIFLIALKLAGEGGVLWPLAFSRVSSSGIALITVLFVRLRRGDQSGQPLSTRLVLLASVAGILDTTGNLLYTLATRAGRLDVSAVLSSLYPAGTILLAMWILKERSTRTQAVGMVMAMIAVVLISI